MTVTIEQIVEIESYLTTGDDMEVANAVADLKDWQPDLFDWFTHKFNSLTSPNALLGVIITVLALIKADVAIDRENE